MITKEKKKKCKVHVKAKANETNSKKMESYVVRVKKNSAAREKNEIKIRRHDFEHYFVAIVASRYTFPFFFQNKCVTHMSCLRICG